MCLSTDNTDNSGEDNGTKKEHDATDSTTINGSIFARLGGVPAVRAAVEEFYHRVTNDPRLSDFFDDTSLTKLKLHQLDFFKMAFGATPVTVDIPTLMIDKHRRLFIEQGLNETHFDWVAGHFVDTLQHLQVPQPLLDDAVAVVLPLRAAFEQGALLYVPGHVAPEKDELSSHDSALSIKGTLLAKLGGMSALKAAVSELYDRLLNDPELSPFFETMNMVMLKQHQIQFMRIAFTQIPEDLDVAALILDKHRSLFAHGLNESHFDKVAQHFVDTLVHLGVEATSINEAVAVIVPLRAVFEKGALTYQEAVEA